MNIVNHQMRMVVGSDSDDRLKGLFDTSHIASAKGLGDLGGGGCCINEEDMKIVMRMTSSKILKMISIWWNKLGNP